MLSAADYSSCDFHTAHRLRVARHPMSDISHNPKKRSWAALYVLSFGPRHPFSGVTFVVSSTSSSMHTHKRRCRGSLSTGIIWSTVGPSHVAREVREPISSTA
jgi:hypothetical protein